MPLELPALTAIGKKYIYRRRRMKGKKTYIKKFKIKKNSSVMYTLHTRAMLVQSQQKEIN